ncbi:hypothetical protein PCNPT3_09875 [Psychromonas sp. CNPT3]|uniref:FAD-dependent oxidoreductase n=1 Tax=Psychromonas sp. CNPT3 TaxID=314282 RepID=UPI00006E9CD8|nr:FAD-dependent oxidoreductase [Psychromonas sp. CNPT3]AGH81913.1 hypothetical protein PCNPT3_09875 [Psychromonas sp. CNPT3]
MNTSKKHLSYWLKDALEKEKPAPAKTLQQDIETDVLIVGGGYTGLWTAILHKQQAPDKTVTLIEKGLCGSGASGSNGGCLLTWSSKYPTLKKLFGETQAQWLVKESEQVIFEIEDFCAEHNIDAQLLINGSYYSATNSAQQGTMAPLVSVLEALNINSWQACASNTLASKTGSKKNREAYFSKAAGTVQPAMLARGLRKVALSLGINIYENTQMLSLHYGQPARVITEQGSITAKQVVLAINAWMAEKFKAFKHSIVVVSSDMVITKPIPELLKKHGPEKGVSVVDSRIFVHYYRDTIDGRLMLGKGGNCFSFGNKIEPMSNQKTRYLPLLSNAFSNLFPQLNVTEFADNWTGGSDRTITGLPFFGNIKGQPNIIYGLGYSGNGVAQTRIGAKILNAMLLGNNDKWANCGLTGGPRGYFPPEPFCWLGAMCVRNAIRRKEDAEDNEQHPRLIDKWLAKLAGTAGKADKI